MINIILTLIVDNLKNAITVLLSTQQRFILTYNYLNIFQGEAKKTLSPISANLGVQGGKKLFTDPSKAIKHAPGSSILN